MSATLTQGQQVVVWHNAAWTPATVVWVRGKMAMVRLFSGRLRDVAMNVSDIRTAQP